VLFSGSSDKKILKKLNNVEYNILNILCYDTTNTQRIYLQWQIACVTEEKKKSMYIKPKHDFLAVTKWNELYSTYDNFIYNFNPTIYKSVHEFLVCPETHPLHSRSMRLVCEILLMQEPREVPESCEVRHVEMATTVFHKLKHNN